MVCLLCPKEHLCRISPFWVTRVRDEVFSPDQCFPYDPIGSASGKDSEKRYLPGSQPSKAFPNLRLEQFPSAGCLWNFPTQLFLLFRIRLHLRSLRQRHTKLRFGPKSGRTRLMRNFRRLSPCPWRLSLAIACGFDCQLGLSCNFCQTKLLPKSIIPKLDTREPFAKTCRKGPSFR